MTASFRHIPWTAFAAVSALSATVGAASAHAQTAQPGTTPAGTEISNIATVTYTVADDVPQTVDSSVAVFTVRPPRTPATIQFFRYAPTAGFAVDTPILGSDYRAGDSFLAVPAPTNPGGVAIDTTRPVPLIPAETYLAGETLFLRVTDESANRDASAIDTLEVTITTDTGDLLTLRLYETGPDTGEFFGYMASSPDETPQNDPVLSTPDNSNITASYTDAFDQTDTVVDSALVDPLNRVFSSVNGAPVSGATVTLLDAATREPVTTLGVDGFSSFPASQVSGAEVIDGAGLVYTLEDGQFRLPNVPEGAYLIEVDPPEDYTFSSLLDPSTIEAQTDGSFVLTPASFGELFTVTDSGPLRFDIPLDPVGEILVSKTADMTTADVGDFVAYTVTVENRGQVAMPLRVHDTLPLGFRYVPGTSRMDSAPIADPEVDPSASALTFEAGLIQPGQSIDMRYALRVGPGAPLGDAVNRALVIGPDGRALSNIARAEITLREDLLRSTSTVIGRISENACDGDAGWAREIVRGDGVGGVRLYTETGAYAVTDADGLYHFEGVGEGVHVVQVDTDTLPDGFSMMTCEENTQYAGRNFSKFIDVQGGGIWRANFYLERTGAVAQADTTAKLTQQTAYKAFDQAWIEEQSPTPELVYPPDGETPATPSLNLGFKHAVGTTVRLFANGRPVSQLNRDGALRDAGNSVMLSRWRGVDLLDGPNRLVAEFVNADGEVIDRIEREVSYVRTIARAHALPDQSTLIADGYTVPKLAIRLEDEAGRAVHAGRAVTVDVESPYLLEDPSRDLRLEGTGGAELIEPLSARELIAVGEDGVLHVPLEPTLRTGKATVIVTLDTGRRVPLTFYMEPEKRDWIVVGLAETMLGFENVRDRAVEISGNDFGPVDAQDVVNGDDDGLMGGRVAFFAKGLIKGEWLMTLAVDTDADRSDLGRRDAGFRDEIDPNAYYTLYGDRSYQELEGVSRYPLYLKLEKRQGYALFGDFETDIREGRLTAYNRRLSGLKAEYVGDDVQLTGFAAETNQGFALDELAADGTSGTYRLTNQRILNQSEEIVIETRDRVRPDVVLDRRVMVRYLDYTLDYYTGELIFRLPVDASDGNFNPNVIVASYETSEDTERNVTFGGRAQVELMDDRLTVGSTGVREDGSALSAGSESTLIGVDAVLQATESTQVRGEYAVSEDKSTGVQSEGILAEIVHTSDDIQVETYLRREEAGFGLGQRTSNTNGVQRFGVRADYTVSESEDKDTGAREVRALTAAAYREDNLQTDASRSSVEITARQSGGRLDVLGGVRVTEDNFADREDRQSILATSAVRYQLPRHGANVSVTHEQPLGGGADEVSVNPRRTTIGMDKTVGDWGVATLRHEWLDGANAKSTSTALGFTAKPWSGSQLTLASDALSQNSARRLGATVGLDQQVRLDENWSVSAGARGRRVFDGEGNDFVQVAPDAAVSPVERNENFNSAYLGAAYRTDTTTVSTRVEGRSSSAGDTYIVTAAAARELSETLSLAGAVRGFASEPEGSSEAESRVEGRLGVAWRPRDEDDVVVFNRFDATDAKSALGIDSRRFVNNLAVNSQVSDRWQLTGHWGVKHVNTDYNDGQLDSTTPVGTSLSSWTNLVGAETRYDITEWLDVGARGQAMISEGDTLWSVGPSVGIAPMDNLWVGAGYNFAGYSDDDFEAAEHSRKGPYIQLRFKFDQQSTEGLLRRISPRSQDALPAER